MKNYIYQIVILILITFCAKNNCQVSERFIVKGTVINNSTEKKLGFVNIGIVGKNIGTISSESGDFELSLPDSLKQDSLTFSYIGFERLAVKISDLTINQERLIKLRPKELVIDEVLVIAAKPVTKKYGTKGHNPMLFVPAYIDKDIYELAFLVKSKKYPAKAKTLNLFIVKSDVDTCRFRINFYAIKNGKPGKILNSQNIIIKRSINGNDWNSIDLTKYKLFFDNDFFVSVEFLPDFKSKEKYQIAYGCKAIKGGKTYNRSSSLGDWEDWGFNTSFNIELIH